jgi:hypothetical protein
MDDENDTIGQQIAALVWENPTARITVSTYILFNAAILFLLIYIAFFKR